jgi:hypothetical protein
MSKEHTKVAKKISGSIIRCGPRRMLQYICEKCGSGVPFKTKGGKEITMPLGEYQITDREMMTVLGTNRRKTVQENRRAMLKACKGAVATTYEYKRGCRYPVIVYHVDLDKLAEIAQLKRPESVHSKWSETDQSKLKGWTETATHTGVPSERIVPTSTQSVEIGGVGGMATPSTTQRSAARRSGEATSPDKTEYGEQDIKNIQSYLNSLEGYEGGASPELATRFLNALISTGDRMVLFCYEPDDDPDGFCFDWDRITALFRGYLDKAEWLRNKTQGRLDWLVDRIESKGDRSVLAQFETMLRKGTIRLEPAEEPTYPWICPKCNCTEVRTNYGWSALCPNCSYEPERFELEEV